MKSRHLAVMIDAQYSLRDGYVLCGLAWDSDIYIMYPYEADCFVIQYNPPLNHIITSKTLGSSGSSKPSMCVPLGRYHLRDVPALLHSYIFAQLEYIL